MSIEYRLRKLGRYLRGWTAYFGINQYYRHILELDERLLGLDTNYATVQIAEGEYQMHIEHFGQPSLQPGLLGTSAALWAVPIAAGVVLPVTVTQNHKLKQFAKRYKLNSCLRIQNKRQRPIFYIKPKPAQCCGG